MCTLAHEWSEEEIRQLSGHPKSGILELIDAKRAYRKTAFRKTLSRHVSAFANAEGGTIVVGVPTDRSRPPVAVMDEAGLDPERLPVEQVRGMLTACVSPPVPGLTCRVIPLSGPSSGRVAYVISVPAGRTAHQAHDYVYYMRDGASSAPLPHHLLCLLMRRGSLPRAELDIGQREILPKDTDDEYRFELLVRNTGEVTLHDMVLEVRIDVNTPDLNMWAPTMFVDDEDAIRDELKSVESMLEIGDNLDERERHDILHGPGIPFQSGDMLRCSFRRILQLLYQVDGKAIFPRDCLIFPGGKWLIESIPRNTALRAYHPVLHWTLYLPDAPPCSGSINLADTFETHQQDGGRME